ncbi:hypothetical protein [Dechloromonas sp. H13]|uniref:hypothetical protein n=1 Tax=Dechloromonas sp. H13 TaxID=2570193 RepID=UPI001291DAA2|nr:hypothetical protein [Dechloromonas sp. H13]
MIGAHRPFKSGIDCLILAAASVGDAVAKCAAVAAIDRDASFHQFRLPLSQQVFVMLHACGRRRDLPKPAHLGSEGCLLTCGEHPLPGTPIVLDITSSHAHAEDRFGQFAQTAGLDAVTIAQ